MSANRKKNVRTEAAVEERGDEAAGDIAPQCPILVIGGSAGGIEAISRVAQDLPANLPAAVFVVIHLGARSGSVLAQVIDRAGPLPAANAVDGEPIKPGRIYLAPADQHLVIEGGHIRLARGAKENGHRPAIDVTMRSAARYHGPRATGVVVSGCLDDGTIGLHCIKEAGGTAVVQSPEDALFAEMPRSALEYVKVDHCLPVSEMGSLLARLARGPEELPSGGITPLEGQTTVFSKDNPNKRPGSPSTFACPHCHGILWESAEDDIVKFECRVGHSFSAQTLASEHTDSVERALWSAMRALEESAELHRRLADRSRARGHALVAKRFDDRAAEKEEHALVLRNLLLASEAAQ